MRKRALIILSFLLLIPLCLFTLLDAMPPDYSDCIVESISLLCLLIATPFIYRFRQKSLVLPWGLILIGLELEVLDNLFYLGGLLLIGINLAEGLLIAVGALQIVLLLYRREMQQKELQIALGLSEYRYRTLVEAVPEIITQADIDGHFVWANDSGLDFFGQDVCMHYFQDYLNPEQADETRQEIRRLLRGMASIIQFENQVRRSDGQLRLLRWQSKPLMENDRITGTLSTARDMTGWREAEARLKASEEKYRHLFEQCPIGLVKIDAELNITDVNPYFLSILGASSREEVVGLNLLNQAVTGTVLPTVKDKMENLFSRGQSEDIEFKLLTYWGKAVWMHYKAEPVFNHENEVVEVIIVGEEINERKAAEEKIKYLSFHDSLTGLFNRAFLDREFSRLDTPRQLPISVIVGDVNGLKLINDAFGHEKGDRLLKDIAGILQASCREEDIIARWGGDEFVILLPQTSGDTARLVCERINRTALNHTPNPIQLSMALGVATKARPAEDIREVLARAEDMMYRNKLQDIKETRLSILSSLETTLLENTPEDLEHLENLRELCVRFSYRLGLSDNHSSNLFLLARVHDIGNIAMPDIILNKPDPLSAEEWDTIKKHPEIGYRIVQCFPELSAVADEVLSHHERWDGTGYPRGLTGENIPQLSRIVAMVDAFDVITHGRCYQASIPPELALQEIRRCAGSQFDPALVNSFCSLFE